MRALRLGNVEETSRLMPRPADDKAKSPLPARLIARAVAKYDAYSRAPFDRNTRKREAIAFFDERFDVEPADTRPALFRSPEGGALVAAQSEMLGRLQKTRFQSATEYRGRIDRILKETVA